MTFNMRLVLVAAAVMSVVIYGIFLMPPLTSGGSSIMPGVSQEALDQAVGDERAYCEASGRGVDCACFAGKAGLIRAAEGPRIPGALYPDQKQLARDQAASSC